VAGIAVRLVPVCAGSVANAPPRQGVSLLERIDSDTDAEVRRTA